MPLITATSAWQSTTLAQDEIWQNRTYDAPVLVTCETPTGPDDLRGIRLEMGEVRVFRSGQTVSWRRIRGPSVVDDPVQLSREAHQ